MFRNLLLYIIALTLFTQTAFAETDQSPYKIKFHTSFSGGIINDKAVLYSAGRETQIYKIINATAGVNIKNSSGWETQLDLVLIGDEAHYDPEDSAYNDYYKNLGADLYYYGKYPVKNAFLAYTNKKSYRFQMGRMINVYGMDNIETLYSHRYDAPHAIYLDKELLTGLSISKRIQSIELTGAILSGRGRPDSDYNYYLNGQTDPNIKGNNTPILEYKIKWQPTSTLSVSHSGHRNKTGSAPGELFNGKHNDERYAFGFQYSSNFQASSKRLKYMPNFTLYAQIQRYVIGLTENGTQGDATPTESKDINKDGAFLTLNVSLPKKLNLQISYEHLDRMDSLVWKEIAQFQPDHESFQSIEKNTMIKLGYQFTQGINIHAFYRQSDFDYQQLSGITPDKPIDTDKFGIVVSADLDLFF